jgi:hypothetical protein
MKIKRPVWQNKNNKQKLVTIPAKVPIEAGDEVWITKAKKENKIK